LCSFARVQQTNLAWLGFVYVALAVAGLGLLDGSEDARSAGAALFSVAAAAFLWFLGTLVARLMRYEPRGFFAAIVLAAGAMSIAVQVVAVALVARSGPGDILSFLSALGAPAEATVVIASSLAAMEARKVSKRFGRAGFAGGLGILGVGFAEAADKWTLTDTYSASWFGFMIWVAVTAYTLLRR
jgi:hypothetical protein